MASAAGGEYKKYPWYKKVLLVWTHDGSKALSDYVGSWGFEQILVAFAGFLVLLVAAFGADPHAVVMVAYAVAGTSPFWLPVYLGQFFWVSWMHYIRFEFWFSQKFVLLQIELPPEVIKTPLSMELFLTALWNSGGENTFLARFWKGSFRAIWTLEIASNQGQIHFYIHTREVWRQILEARLYGQFPEARITAVDDYVAKVPFDLAHYDIFGVEYTKNKADAIPIKTYTDYGLDKPSDKPELQVDPITNILELMASVGKDQYFWFQIIMKARKKDEWYGLYKKTDSFTEGANAAIKEIQQGAIARARDLTDDEAEKKKVGARGAALMTEAERDRVNAIQRSLNKNLFECGLRVVYISKNTIEERNPNHGINNGAIIRFFDAYRAPEYNRLDCTRDFAWFDFPWQDYGEFRQNIVRRNLWFRYKHRAYFYVPYDQVPVMLTTEELATIWHFPSSVVKTPGLTRVGARVSDAPLNLPVGEI